MPLGNTCFKMRWDVLNVRWRDLVFCDSLQAFNATMAHAAPAASQSSDSTPRALSRGVRTDDAVSGFISVRRAPSARPLYEPSCPSTSSPAMRFSGVIRNVTVSESSLDSCDAPATQKAVARPDLGVHHLPGAESASVGGAGPSYDCR